MRCLRGQGVQALDPRYNRRGFTYGFLWPSGPQTDPVARRCMAQRFEPTNRAWQRANAPRIEALDRELHQLVERCVRAAGTAPGPDAVKSRCLERAVRRQAGALT